MTTSSTTTLELPRNLRFTIGEQPEPVIVETRLTRIAARQRAAMARDGVAAAAAVGLAIMCALGFAGF